MFMHYQKKVSVYVKCLLVSLGQSGSLVSSCKLLYNCYVCSAGMCVGFSKDIPHGFFSCFSLGWYGSCHPKFSELGLQLLFMFLFFLIIIFPSSIFSCLLSFCSLVKKLLWQSEVNSLHEQQEINGDSGKVQ